MGEIFRERPGREIPILVNGELSQTGEAGEESGGERGELIPVEVDVGERREAGEVRERAGERVLLEL